MEDLKKDINSILDIKRMATEALTNEPRVMVNMFRDVAARELVFITHVAAVMGFLLGLVQLLLYTIMDGKWKYADYVVLPVSGLIIGYFTNWLALKMTFAPIWPHMKCGNYLNFQGVFLKRQTEAAEQMADAICSKVIDAQAMMDYMFRNSANANAMEAVLEIYKRHISESLDKQLGGLTGIAPASVGEQFQRLKDD